MAEDSTASLEGEIVQRRYAIVEVNSTHGDWVRCRVFDMQEMAQRDAVVQIGEDGEHEIQLLPAEEPSPPQPAKAAAPTPAPAPVKAAPVKAVEPAPAPVKAVEPARAPGPPPAPPPSPPMPPSPSLRPIEDPELLRREDLELRREDLEAFKGKTREKNKAGAKPGKLEAAWFAVGDDADNIAEEDRPDADDGDLLIAPSKVEQKATELTTKTYMRYRIDTSNPQLRAARNSAPPVALPGKGRLWLLLAAAGVGLAVLVVLLLALR